jgi:hypothetical protein
MAAAVVVFFVTAVLSAIGFDHPRRNTNRGFGSGGISIGGLSIVSGVLDAGALSLVDRVSSAGSFSTVPLLLLPFVSSA